MIGTYEPAGEIVTGTFALERIGERIGIVPAAQMTSVDTALRVHLAL